MKIAIMSDSHDNIWKLDQALAKVKEADALIHCGDLCSPFVIKHLGEWAEGKPVFIVWGNNDGDRLMITSNAEAYKSITLCGEYARLELDGTRIFVTHYPGIAESVADSADYDLVCYGHDHTQAKKEVSDTLLLNPGEIMGLNGTSSLALFDTKSKKCLFIDV
jgi:uncharacterized protein